jgi:hypothetical protein
VCKEKGEKENVRKCYLRSVRKRRDFEKEDLSVCVRRKRKRRIKRI